MSDTEVLHIILNYDTIYGDDLTEYYAVSSALLQQAEEMKAVTKTVSAWELAGWLRSHGAKLDRADGPAYIERYKDGTTRELYFRNGAHHREDGPAVIESRADGTTIEAYYSEGKCHRQDGPAVIRCYATRFTIKEYWRDGRRIADPISSIPGVTVQRFPNRASSPTP